MTSVNIPVTTTTDKKVKRVWAATPDFHGGAVQELAFEQKGTSLSFTVPQLKYWTMIVIEQ